MPELDLNADIIDVRDIIARLEALEGEQESWMLIAPDGTETPDPSGWIDSNTDDAAELAILTSILSDLKGYGGDEQWRGDWYPLTLIADNYFETYAEELADDIGAIDRDARWPINCIDWEAAANQLKVDYSTIEIEGDKYWYR